MGTPSPLVVTGLGRVVPAGGVLPGDLVAVPGPDGQLVVKVLPRQVTVRNLLGALAGKAVDTSPGDHGYHETQHPRDRKGRWIEKGARVKIGIGGGQGIVQSWDGERVTVKRDDGGNVIVSARRIEAIPSRPGDPKPERAAPSGGRQPAADVAPGDGGAPNDPNGSAPNAPVSHIDPGSDADKAAAANFDEYWQGFAAQLRNAGVDDNTLGDLRPDTERRAHEIGVLASLTEARDRINDDGTLKPLSTDAPNAAAPDAPATPDATAPAAPDAPMAPRRQDLAATPAPEGAAAAVPSKPVVPVDVQHDNGTKLTPMEKLNLALPEWRTALAGEADSHLVELEIALENPNDPSAVDPVETLTNLRDLVAMNAMDGVQTAPGQPPMAQLLAEMNDVLSGLKDAGHASNKPDGPLTATQRQGVNSALIDLIDRAGFDMPLKVVDQLSHHTSSVSVAVDDPNGSPATVNAAIDKLADELLTVYDKHEGNLDIATALDGYLTGPIKAMRDALGPLPGSDASTTPTPSGPAVPKGIHPASTFLPGKHDPAFVVDVAAAQANPDDTSNNAVGAAFLDYNGGELLGSAKLTGGTTIKPGDTVKAFGSTATVLGIRDVAGFYGPSFGGGTDRVVLVQHTNDGAWGVQPLTSLTTDDPVPNTPKTTTGAKGTVLDVAAVEAAPGAKQSESQAVTKAMALAAKQKWKLPKGTIAELQDALAKIQAAPVPSVTELMDSKGLTAEEATKEYKRLHRNSVNTAWKHKTRHQAAIDILLRQDAKGKAGGVDAATEAVGGIENLDPNNPKHMDLMLAKGDAPKALYTLTPAEKDALVSAGKPLPPGNVGPQARWYDKLGALKAGDPPIPVVGLVTEGGYHVHSGWAYKDTSGRAYLVEARAGETVEQTLARAAETQKLVDGVLEGVPAEHRGVLRGVQLVEGANPKDAYWAEQYNTPGFVSGATGGMGGITVWNGQTPKPTTVAHEFGHNVDPHLGGLAGMGSDSPQWEAVASLDAVSSSAWSGKYVETRLTEFVKPVHLGEGGVTSYGNNSPGEDFAESVRLWLKDRREGKIGYDKTTGNNLRFSDVFPERARHLDALFGVENDQETPARAAARAAAELHFYNEIKAKGPDALGDLDAVMAQTGLPRTTVAAARSTAVSRWAEEKQAEEAAAKAKAKAEAAAKAEAEKWAKQYTTVKEALAAGVIDQATAKTIANATASTRFAAKKKGATPEEAEALAAQYMAARIAKAILDAGGGPGTTTNNAAANKQLLKAKSAAKLKQSVRLKAHQFLQTAGQVVHPSAEKQTSGSGAQAKANIAAALADRLDNKADWELFRKYLAQPRSFDYNESGYGSQGVDLGVNTGVKVSAWEDTTKEYRAKMLQGAVSARVSQWAASSGDSNQTAVLMQHAVKEEFGVTGHPAPTVSEATYQGFLEVWPQVGDWYKRVARAMYDNTQADLKKAGITEVAVYRGMHFGAYNKPEWVKHGTDGPAHLQPANSWSTQLSTSQAFASGDTMLVATFPAEAVLGSAYSGFGCLTEFEYVIFDTDGDVVIRKQHEVTANANIG